jgi:hypothetical protein
MNHHLKVENLPDEINSLILSFLVYKNPKSALDIESYSNLSLVNKEFNKNITKYKNAYKNLKDIISDYKRDHKYSFEIVKYQILDKTPIIIASTSNEGCLVCGNHIPIWWPMLYSSNSIELRNRQNCIRYWDEKTRGCIGYGLCGNCDSLCGHCKIKFEYYKLRKLKFDFASNCKLICSGCYKYVKCYWCSTDVHPLKNLNSQIQNESNYDLFCSLKCFEEHQDYQFSVFSCR